MNTSLKPNCSRQKFLKCGSAWLLCATGLLCAPALAQDAILSAEAQFMNAVEAYEQNHWTEAFLGFSRLADKGDAEAARIAFQMSKYGTALYKTAFLVTGSQYERWRAASKPDPTVN